MKYVFIDAEYCFTCSVREGQLPNYKNIMELFNNDGSDEKTIKYVYHVGAKENKRGVCDFLTRIGVDYNIILEYDFASKTQLVGATMSFDVATHCLTQKEPKDNKFYFLTGDDYLIPIVSEAFKYNQNLKVFYFPWKSCLAHKLLVACLLLTYRQVP